MVGTRRRREPEPAEPSSESDSDDAPEEVALDTGKQVNFEIVLERRQRPGALPMHCARTNLLAAPLPSLPLAHDTLPRLL